MMSRAAKLLASVVCSTSLLGAMAAPADACCFLDCLFGCGRPCGGGGCGPAYYGPTTYGGGCSSGSCGTSTYYGPAWYAGYGFGNTCAPCGSSCSSGCAPCASGSCASGECALGQSPAVATPANEQWRSKDNVKTYIDPAPANGAPSGRTQPDAGFEGKNGQPEAPTGGNTTSRFQSPATPGDSGIQQTGGEDENSNPIVPISPGSKKSGPTAPRIPDDNDESGSGRLPTLNLDGKVASRAAPERKRVTLRPTVAKARLIRVPAYPKSDWIPVDADAKVAKK